MSHLPPAGVDPGPEASCAVCGAALDGILVACPRCETPHHQECWDYNEGCAVFGCKAALAVVRERAAAVIGGDTVPALTEDIPSAGLPALAYNLSLIPPNAWRLSAGLVLFAAIGMVTSVATWQGFFGSLSVIMLVFPVFAIVLFALADWWPEIFLDVARGGRPREVEETPLKRLEARLGEDPKNPNLLEMVAFGCYADGRLEDALELYGRYLLFRPEDRRALYQRARCLERLGRGPEAIPLFRSLAANRIDEELADKARFWLGILERRSEEMEK